MQSRIEGAISGPDDVQFRLWGCRNGCADVAALRDRAQRWTAYGRRGGTCDFASAGSLPHGAITWPSGL